MFPVLASITIMCNGSNSVYQLSGDHQWIQLIIFDKWFRGPLASISLKLMERVASSDQRFIVEHQSFVAHLLNRSYQQAHQE